MKKTRILYMIDSFYSLAGAERNLFELVTRLNKEKYEPIVFALQANETLDIFRENGIRRKNLNIKRIYGFRALVEAVRMIFFKIPRPSS